MTSEIRQRASAKGPPMPPVDRQILRAIRPFCDGPQPQIIMQTRRYRRGIRGPIFAAVSSIHTNKDLCYFANRSAFDQFYVAAIVVSGMNYRPNLHLPIYLP